MGKVEQQMEEATGRPTPAAGEGAHPQKGDSPASQLQNSNSPTAEPKLYVILLNYNGWADTIEALEGLCRQEYTNFQIVVVDNNSRDGSLEYLQKWANRELCCWLPPDNPHRERVVPPLEGPVEFQLISEEELFTSQSSQPAQLNHSPQPAQLHAPVPPSPPVTSGRALPSETGSSGLGASTAEVSPSPTGSPLRYPIVFITARENRGFSGGNNLGLRWAYNQRDGDYFLILNNDISIPRDFLKNLISSTIKISEKAGLVGVKIYQYYSPNQVWNSGNLHHFLSTSLPIRQECNGIQKTDYIVGCAMLIPKKTLERVGFLDENYFLYIEDGEYSMRSLLLSSSSNFIVCNTFIFHKVSASTKGLSSPLEYYYSTRNRLYFHYRYHRRTFPLFFPLFLATRLIRTLQFLPARRWDLIAGIWAGVWDFLRGKTGKWDLQ